jgi:hypothetical protein
MHILKIFFVVTVVLEGNKQDMSKVTGTTQGKNNIYY